MQRLAAIFALPFIITACGSDDDSSTADAFPRTLDLGEHYSATFDMSDVEKGVADITVSIQSTDGSPLPDEAVTISPLMQMNSGMNHDTPMSVRSGDLNDDGQFHTTAYFLMPSGDELGTWSMTVEFDGEMETFAIDVDMMMSEREMLRGTEDKINGMNGEEFRPYFLFNEGRHIGEQMDHFSVYIAARETMMKHTSLENNITLTGEMPMEMDESMPMAMMISEDMTSYDLNITSIEVDMCAAQDCDTNENSWVPAVTVEGYPGLYRAMNLGLAGDNTDVIHVRLIVNEEQKIKNEMDTVAIFTFDGSASSTTEMSNNH